MIGVAASATADRFRDRDNGAVIGDNSAGIGDNSVEIVDGRIDRRYGSERDPMLNSIPGRQIPERPVAPQGLCLTCLWFLAW